jgi:CBS domain-containing protein
MAGTVAEIMTRELVTVGADDPVTRAAALMRDAGTGDVLVVDDGRLVGIITDRDVTVRVVAAERDPRGTAVREACSSEIETVSPVTSVGDAAEVMRLRAVRRLPVVDGERVVGIVSLGDLAMERNEESVLGQISAMPDNR